MKIFEGFLSRFCHSGLRRLTRTLTSLPYKAILTSSQIGSGQRGTRREEPPKPTAAHDRSRGGSPTSTSRSPGPTPPMITQRAPSTPPPGGRGDGTCSPSYRDLLLITSWDRMLLLLLLLLLPLLLPLPFLLLLLLKDR